MISMLFFADGQLRIAIDEMDLDYMVRKLNEAFNQGGLKINYKKSEYLFVGNNMISDLKLEEGKKLSGMGKYKYLGVIFTNDGKSRMELNERIIKGRKITRALNPVLWDKTIRRSTKMKIYTCLVRIVITYGAEV